MTRLLNFREDAHPCGPAYTGRFCHTPRGLGVLFLILFFCFLVSSCNRPEASGIESDEIDISQEPIQMSVPSEEETTVIKVKKGEFKITPVAAYRIAALVVGKEPYSSGWNAKISPIDLGLVWGKLAEPDCRKYISYSQDNRWLSFNVKRDCPVDPSYVNSHASNNHIIPSTQNIWYAVKTIREKQKVVLEGFLVNVAGTYNGRTVWWNTSRSRTDSGDGACEILFVTKVRIENKVYE